MAMNSAALCVTLKEWLGHFKIDSVEEIFAKWEVTEIADLREICTDEYFIQEVECSLGVDDFIRFKIACRCSGIVFQQTESLVQSPKIVEKEIVSTAISEPKTFHHACYVGRIDVVKSMVDAGSDINMVDDNGQTGLHITAKKGWIELIQFLVKSGADLNCIEATQGYSPLLIAIAEAKIDSAIRLIEVGADISTPDRGGRTAAYIAARDGHFDLLKRLVDAGADVTVLNAGGWSLINAAADSGCLSVVRYLLEIGADITIPNDGGWLPIICAADEGHTEVVELLLTSGADIEATNNDLWTPLNCASLKGHVEVVKRLIAAGAKTDSMNKCGWLPLHSAAARSHPEVVKLLLDGGADIDAISGEAEVARTALHLACSHGSVEVVSVLLDAGADWALLVDSSWSPLRLAAYFGHSEVVRLLIESGATTPDQFIDLKFHKSVEVRHSTAVVDAITSLGGALTLFHCAHQLRRCKRLLEANPSPVSLLAELRSRAAAMALKPRDYIFVFMFFTYGASLGDDFERHFAEKQQEVLATLVGDDIELQRHLIATIGWLVAERFPSSCLDFATLLKDLYDRCLIEEDAILDWHRASQRDLQSALSLLSHATLDRLLGQLTPLVAWLQEAEEAGLMHRQPACLL